MSETNVRIVKLEPLRVAASLGFGAGPEPIAWQKLFDWIKRQGITDLKAHRFFGFNNPDPSPGSPNYGYEQWITVGPEVEPAGDVKIKDFSGGLYAVMHCKGIPNPGIWGQLVAWREHSAYRCAEHQWLEECLTPGAEDEAQYEFELYLPTTE